MSSLVEKSEVTGTRSRPVAHAEFLGLPFCPLSPAEVMQLIITSVGMPYRYAVTPNAHHVVTVLNEPERLLPVYQGAWLSLCDSQVLRALAKLDWLTARTSAAPSRAPVSTGPGTSSCYASAVRRGN